MPNRSEQGLVPIAVNTDQGNSRWWLGSLAVIKLASAQTGGAFTLVEVTENEGETPRHLHHNEDETFVVLEGEIRFEVGDQIIEAGPGTIVFGPRGVPHGYSVKRGPARMLFILTPGGFENLIEATSVPAGANRIPDESDAMPDYEALPEIVSRFGCELLN